ncbi:hypothetical protein [Corynebacterium glutamicum]|uniref:hypothetical protein n=1 Tax=Corynebacterium glutamicum TaxID=1718 RepID=UPI001B8B08CD|nr:hypothetical protein [Corynebacterium glutamicum]
MANPAELLHRQLSHWSSKNHQESIRNLTDEESWIFQRQAARNLDHLDELLSEMSKAGKIVSFEREYFISWTKAVFAYPSGWNTNNSALISKDALNVLGLTGQRLADLVLPIADNATEDMLAAAQELEEDLKQRGDIPPALQILVHESLGFLRNAVFEYEVTGEFILNKAVKKFGQTLELLEASFPGDTTLSRLKDRLRHWYKAAPAQMALAGIISAQMALAVPPVNEAITTGTQQAIETATSIFELPTGSANQDKGDIIEGESPLEDTPEEPDQ